MKEKVILFVVAAPLSLLVLSIVMGFLGGLLANNVGDVCPDDVRGFEDGNIVVESFEEDEGQLSLLLQNDGDAAIEVESVAVFSYVEDYEETIEVSEDLEPGDSLKVSTSYLEDSNNCNDLPVEVFYTWDDVENSNIGSVSAYLGPV